VALEPAVRGFDRHILARLRREADLTIAELGLRADVTGSVLSRWETGRASPTPELLRRVAEAIGVSTSEFVDTPAEERTLADLRSLAGYSQRALARRLGVPFKAVTKLEHGLIDLDETRARALAVVLGVSVAELKSAYRRGAIRMLRHRLAVFESEPAAASA
jgi:transcriptional regulator with XRE-family HTH domain